MPIYKANGKKDGLQKYIVRINYVADSGQHKQLTRIAYGNESAKDLERRLNKEIKDEDKKPIKKMTVQELFIEYKKNRTYELRKRTLLRIEQVYNCHVMPYFENYRIDRITLNDIQNWKATMQEKNLALVTKQTAFIYFNAMMNYAVKMEYLQKNPLSIIGNFKDTLTIKADMKFYTPKEFSRFISAAKKIAQEKESGKSDVSEWNYYVFFNVAFYTGLRKGEIHALKWSDIDGSYLMVKRSMTQSLKGVDIETAPKNKSSIRTLQMPLHLIRVLKKHRQRQLLYNLSEDRICNNLRDTTLQRKNEIYSTKAKLKTIRIHDFRHSHASVLANRNVNIQEVARRLGHARIEITWNTYCHLYPKEAEKAVAIFNSTLDKILHIFTRFIWKIKKNKWI